MSTKPVYLTSEGIKKLEDRLEYLTSTRRSEIADRIKAAIALGDLSENSEYIEAKNEQAFLEGEIVQIETTLRHAQIIKAEDIDGSQVARIYWEENDIDRIVRYCEKDTLAVANLLLKYKGDKIIPMENMEVV